MRNPTTTKNAPGEVHTQKIRKLCTQCIHPALTRDSSSPTPTPTASICADAHTATKNALCKWVYTQKNREKCTQCIHPALTRDSPGLQGRLLQPRSKAWENKPERSETMEHSPHTPSATSHSALRPAPARTQTRRPTANCTPSSSPIRSVPKRNCQIRPHPPAARFARPRGPAFPHRLHRQRHHDSVNPGNAILGLTPRTPRKTLTHPASCHSRPATPTRSSLRSPPQACFPSSTPSTEPARFCSPNEPCSAEKLAAIHQSALDNQRRSHHGLKGALRERIPRCNPASAFWGRSSAKTHASGLSVISRVCPRRSRNLTHSTQSAPARRSRHRGPNFLSH